MSFTIRRGVAIRGRLVDADGKPVNDAVMFCANHRPAWEKAVTPIAVHDGRWELRGCDPERTYRLLFLACAEKFQLTMMAEAIGANGRLLLPMLLGPNNKLGTSVEVSAKKAGGEPVEVRLQPTGSARLRFLDAKGRPLSALAPPLLELVVTPGPTFGKALDTGTLAGETVILMAPFGTAVPPALKGEGGGKFLVEGLIPGATYRLRRYQKPDVLKEFTAESGKTVDVDVPVQ
jgi:hypothetical protein